MLRYIVGRRGRLHKIFGDRDLIFKVTPVSGADSYAPGTIVIVGQ